MSESTKCLVCGVSNGDHTDECARSPLWEQELEKSGISEKQIEASYGRQPNRRLKDPDEDTGDERVSEEGLSTIYRFKSWRRRNAHKTIVPAWSKNEILVQLALSFRYGNILSSAKKARHALRTYLRMNLKWEKKNHESKNLDAIRVDLQRTRDAFADAKPSVERLAAHLDTMSGRRLMLWAMCIVVRSARVAAKLPGGKQFKDIAEFGEGAIQRLRTNTLTPFDWYAMEATRPIGEKLHNDSSTKEATEEALIFASTLKKSGKKPT